MRVTVCVCLNQLAVDEKSGEVHVSRIARGTPAHYCGKVAEGDRVVAINGEALASTDPEAWQQWWLDDDLGSPIWLKVVPYNSKKTGDTVDVCLVRYGEDSFGKRKPSTEAQREGCIGVEFDESGSARVVHLEEGGAGWLALLAPAQIPAPVLAGDTITMVDGETIGEGGATRAKKLLAGPAFSRVHFSVTRKGSTQRVMMVRSPRLHGTEQDDAVAFRMDVSRMPAMPPSLRHDRRCVPTVEPPAIGVCVQCVCACVSVSRSCLPLAPVPHL